MYDFDWQDFSESRYNETRAKMNDNPAHDGLFVGCVRVGELCFDLVLRDYGEPKPSLDYDLYVGGIDDGYGYGKDCYPYTYAEGGMLQTCADYDTFKATAEQEFVNYINSYGAYDLPTKAAMPLHTW